MYCKIMPLEMDGGDHVMLIISSTSDTVALCIDKGAENMKFTRAIKLCIICY